MSMQVTDTFEDLENVDHRYNELLSRLGEDLNIGFWERIANESGGSSVLELGCGAGNASIPLAKLGLQVTAVDANSILIEQLRMYNQPGLTPICERFENLHLVSCFKFVFLPSLLLNLVEESTQQEFLACAARHLDREGLFAVEIFRPSWLYDLSTFESERQRIVVEKSAEENIYQVTGTYFFHDATYRHVMHAKAILPCNIAVSAFEYGLKMIEVRRRNPITDVLIFKSIN